jgi:hypothetical protein
MYISFTWDLLHLSLKRPFFLYNKAKSNSRNSFTSWCQLVCSWQYYTAGRSSNFGDQKKLSMPHLMCENFTCWANTEGPSKNQSQQFKYNLSKFFHLFYYFYILMLFGENKVENCPQIDQKTNSKFLHFSKNVQFKGLFLHFDIIMIYTQRLNRK